MIGFVFSDWLRAHEASGQQTIHTYNTLYVSVSGGFSVACMVVNSIMGFYTGYFGHMTKHTCALCKYPHGFVLGDD